MMEQYVGLDVSQDLTHICVVDRDGNIAWQGDCASTPEEIGHTIQRHAPDAEKLALKAAICQPCTGMVSQTWDCWPSV